MKARPRIDLRSDTVTQPTEAMRAAMAKAVVGDDVWGEDPTVKELEEAAAERVGKEAAVFMPSGTMVNQAALWAHSGRQGAMVCESGAHIFLYESGGPALLSNLVTMTIEGRRGVFTGDQLESILMPDDPHYARVKVVEIENTHTRAGGTVWTPAQTRAVADVAHAHGIPLHLDGARIFNSAVAQRVPVGALTDPADSVGFCLSKGLSAPVGSLLCGPASFIQEARRARKILGGAMRQAGVLAAPGLVALETMVDRLAEDHANARRLAAGLAKMEGLRVDMEGVQTNIVLIDIAATHMTADDFCARLEKAGVLAAPRDVGPFVRMVTHRHISRQDIDAAIGIVAELVAPRRAGRDASKRK